MINLKRLLCFFGKHAWSTKYNVGYDKQEGEIHSVGSQD